MSRDEDLERAARVPYRLLEAVPEHGGGDVEARATTPNMLIQGDNLDALKSLLPFYAGKVKCIYIDPPYNTGSAFEHYDDNLEHSQWLAMMWPRIELLRELLSEDGSIWVSCDDREGHYLKVLLDEVFGRKNFVSNLIWEKTLSVKNTAKHFSEDHDHIIVYANNLTEFVVNKLPAGEMQKKSYRNPDDDPRGPWQSVSFSARNKYSKGLYPIVTPGGREIVGPPSGSYWRVSEENFWALHAEGRVWWGKEGKGIPRRKMFLHEQGELEIIPQTIWSKETVGHTQEAKKEALSFSPEDSFPTPKPERLIQRILYIATKPGDLVLDSFLGSGTTAAVAQKMDRSFIGIEMGDHAVTHCVPRLRKVIEGEQGGISEDVNWKGGGGFRFYKLGDPVFDADGRIREGLSFDTLAAHVWFSETHTPLPQFNGKPSPFLGSYSKLDGERGLSLLYNGILGDKSVSGGNVLTSKTLKIIRAASDGFDGPLTIYGERSAFGPATLERENIIFRQTPYDVAAVRRS